MFLLLDFFSVQQQNKFYLLPLQPTGCPSGWLLHTSGRWDREADALGVVEAGRHGQVRCRHLTLYLSPL